MNVKLVSYTQVVDGLKEVGIDGVEGLIAYCARVSNPANQMNVKTSRKLIKFLMAHRHWSPFEMADITLEIETTRDIARQMLRHRSFSFQEFSQRYANVAEFGNETFEFCEPRLQDTKNRQNSVATDDPVLSAQWDVRQKYVAGEALKAYEWAIDAGIAKEVARKLLPEGLTKSRLFMKGSVRSWIHYLEVRGEGSGTQLEHMQVAEKIAEAITAIFNINGLKK
jgi:thymidylate synthase (FAD)